MRILHLFSDYKWTGPAEPTVNLCLALRQRGHAVTFACCRGPAHVRQTIAGKARERGLDARLDLHLSRRFHLLDDLADTRRITRIVEQDAIDIVHVHLSHDHILGGFAARRARNHPLIVRTNHKGAPMLPHRGNEFLLRTWTDGLIGLSPAAAIEDAQLMQARPGQIWTIEGAVDLERFSGAGRREQQRAALGFQPEHVVIGIVARMQRHRRFDVLLEALHQAIRQVPTLRLLIVGRGTHRRRVAEEPAVRLGLREHVVFAGYRSGDFVDVISAMDAKVFLVPGSDGSCRAVREAMAMGKPIVAARRGMLPEIVDHERTGLIVDDTPEQLAEALVRLARDPEARRRMGDAARADAVRRFSLHVQAETVERAYTTLLAQRPPVRRLGWLGV